MKKKTMKKISMRKIFLIIIGVAFIAVFGPIFVVGYVAGCFLGPFIVGFKAGKKQLGEVTGFLVDLMRGR